MGWCIWEPVLFDLYHVPMVSRKVRSIGVLQKYPWPVTAKRGKHFENTSPQICSNQWTTKLQQVCEWGKNCKLEYDPLVLFPQNPNVPLLNRHSERFSFVVPQPHCSVHYEYSAAHDNASAAGQSSQRDTSSANQCRWLPRDKSWDLAKPGEPLPGTCADDFPIYGKSGWIKDCIKQRQSPAWFSFNFLPLKLKCCDTTFNTEYFLEHIAHHAPCKLKKWHEWMPLWLTRDGAACPLAISLTLSAGSKGNNTLSGDLIQHGILLK